MDRRQAFGALAAIGSYFVTARGASAQNSSKTYRIAILAVRARPRSFDTDPTYGVFVQALRNLGYAEGKNATIEWRFADSDYKRLPQLAKDLVAATPDVLVCHTTAGAQAAQAATRTIPIVFLAVADPVGFGLVKSLGRPGTNATGLSNIGPEAVPKRLEVLKAALPRTSRIAYLEDPAGLSTPQALDRLRTASQHLGLRVRVLFASSEVEVQRAFISMKKDRPDAVLVSNDSIFFEQRDLLAQLAKTDRLPCMYAYADNVRSGGLMSYGEDLAEVYSRAASYVARILKGASPGDLPVQEPSPFKLAINLRTAKAIGLSISNEVRLRADEVIE